MFQHFLYVVTRPHPPLPQSPWTILLVKIGLVIILILSAYLIIRLLKSKRKTRNSTKAMPPAEKIERYAVTGSEAGPQFTITMTINNKQETVKIPATIGKAPGCTLCLSDQTVSDRHARLYFDNKFAAVCIEDQGSTNGILVNNRPSRKHLVKLQDQIQIGQTTLVILALQEEIS